MSGSGHEVTLVRHGETEWSLSRQHTGRTEIPLTENGRRQGATLGAYFAGREVGRVFTSPLGRARETCRLAGLADGAEVRDELLEFDYGSYEGRTTAEIREERPGWDLWTDGSPGGETAQDVGRRVDALLEEVRSLGEPAVLFGHGHVLRLAGARWIGLDPEDGARFGLEVGTISRLGWERETPVLRAWNFRPGGS
jgi:probable phosphoglycerate mutase